MKGRKLHITKRIIFSLFLLIMGGIIFNSTFFLHTHKTANGEFVIHAHPFNKNADKGKPLSQQHHHSKIDIHVYKSLHHFVNNASIIEVRYIPVFSSEIISKPSLYYSSEDHSLYSTRGPPFVKSLG